MASLVNKELRIIKNQLIDPVSGIATSDNIIILIKIGLQWHTRYLFHPSLLYRLTPTLYPSLSFSLYSVLCC